MDQQTYPVPPPISNLAPPAPTSWNGKTNGLSITSLTLALFGCGSPLGTILGVIGLRQSRRNGDRRGRLFAILGLSINGLWLLGTAILIAVAIGNAIADGPDRDATGAIRGERSISLTDLRAGDCIKDIHSQSGDYVDVLPCTSAHTSEVFARATLPQGPWAGKAKVQTDAHAACDTRFADYAGVKLDEDAYLLYAVPPEERNWPEDRDVLCIVHRLGGTTVGSLRR